MKVSEALARQFHRNQKETGCEVAEILIIFQVL